MRDELLDAATRLLATGGVASISLRAVAREAGITAPSIYPHFDDREALVQALIDRTWSQLAEHMALAARTACDADPLGALESQLNAYVDFATSNPTRYQLLFAVSPDSEPVDSPEPPPPAPVYLLLEEAVLRCRDAGFRLPLPFGDRPDPSTVLLFVTAHGRVALASVTHRMPFSAIETTREYVHLVLHTLIQPPDPTEG